MSANRFSASIWGDVESWKETFADVFTSKHLIRRRQEDFRCQIFAGLGWIMNNWQAIWLWQLPSMQLIQFHRISELFYLKSFVEFEFSKVKTCLALAVALSLSSLRTAPYSRRPPQNASAPLEFEYSKTVTSRRTFLLFIREKKDDTESRAVLKFGVEKTLLSRKTATRITRRAWICDLTWWLTKFYVFC